MLDDCSSPVVLGHNRCRFAGDGYSPVVVLVSTMDAATFGDGVAASGARGRGECVPYAHYGESVKGVATAIWTAMEDVKTRPKGPVPAHLRDAHYGGSKKLGHGQGYKYAHDEPFGIAEQQYAPDVVADATYYRPTALGAESALKERWQRIRQMVRGRGSGQDPSG